MLTRIDVGGPGKSLGSIADKNPIAIPAVSLTRIAVGGVGRIYSVTDKAPGGPIIPRPGDIYTRIGVGGVGIHIVVTDKLPTEILLPVDTNGYYGTGTAHDRKKREEEEILIFIMTQVIY